MAAKTEFKLPYIGVARESGIDLLYGTDGDFSAILTVSNPVLQYGAQSEAYDDYHNLLLNIVKILGDGYLLQKLDVFSKAIYPNKPAKEFLQQKFNEHFAGRRYIKLETHLVITRQVKRGAFYVFDQRALIDFSQSVNKVYDLLLGAGMQPKILEESQINKLVMQILSMSFSEPTTVLNNIAPNDTELLMGDRAVRSISLINIDSMDLPSEVATHVEWNEKDTIKGFPVDALQFLFKAPGCDCLVYNQVIEIPGQTATLRKLELKKKRHSGIPDPANQTCVEDIDHLLTDVARENQLLVNCHFNILIAADKSEIQKAANYIESSLFGLGIIASKNAYNQLELFRTVLPGNAVELKNYDWFLTTCDAALCFFFKESLPKDEPSDYTVRFTDRQGIPIAIDPSDLPMRTGRINNRNSFTLGPSGSGKSFYQNSLIEQKMLYNTDMVIVDTGHSYSGLCSYYNGKYVTYTDKKPITMNPFAISPEEYNIEKKEFLVTLVCLLWKGAEGIISQVERDVIAHTISAYFNYWFDDHEDDHLLNFNTFYEFALKKIPEIKAEEQIAFDHDEFKYVLKKFYRGGEFETILNEQTDKSLFNERFIVYEIDSIKENKILFPIVTLSIMDLFIQKMRYRSDRRKCLIVEEAWKAIASPLMAGYLLYLYKTVRKFWGEVIVVTQELADIIGNAVVKDSIISNSDTITLLDQNKFKDNYNEIAALLSINEVERKKIFSIHQLNNQEGRGRFKEVYIRRGSTGEVYGVEVSLYQYLAYTTEKPEKSAVEIYVNHFGTYPKALEAFVEALKNSGLQLQQFVSRVNNTGMPLAA
ncbi:TraG family conjugative transposon ATPase [Mucilaginibacter rubeus]|uniref:TraG family conjugative transposon ATPase n=1 Tax=Mucilaginibacter rubeus TaxID=2027860 RepID=A0AAE6JDS1_9SPHI|nr:MULTISPECIES: TraG family conjugative transposon ATPase [Mucilaginibacter]QEM03685.1 TraG family conjugative transposon ATPase [Mucilaginibacter rubeus]QEM16296.1 TraG family conjugative transposon ATPase [Mucilaginibacter gossypii]QTE40942.1 TraG family conjugative transposon ATPase [Mucilaginibacter rubeus]QTE47545.1 TraG family conjugative transposon ATPase [Mucilaginibacter rubeus]QTE58937.1 TraG family conjugative transposon ATPase [Mucilaginibacter rubeus]